MVLPSPRNREKQLKRYSTDLFEGCASKTSRNLQDMQNPLNVSHGQKLWRFTSSTTRKDSNYFTINVVLSMTRTCTRYPGGLFVRILLCKKLRFGSVWAAQGWSHVQDILQNSMTVSWHEHTVAIMEGW